MSLTFIINHVTRALARLPAQYKDKARISGIVATLAEHAQSLEDSYQALFGGRTVEAAVGVQLDGMGQIIGLARAAGQSDELYRESLRIRIVQNLNQATPEEFIAAAKFFLVADVVNFQELFPAAVSVFSTTVILPADRDRIRAFLQRLLPAGVELAAFGHFESVTPFLFDTGSGFGDTNDSAVGGSLADIY